jgi:hypothetical protein
VKLNYHVPRLLNRPGRYHYRHMRDRVATVMALSATVTSSLNMAPGAPCYEEAMKYLAIIGLVVSSTARRRLPLSFL